MATVELKNVGPIGAIEFELPEGQGGVKVFKGTSGAGKTTALRALNGLMGDKDSLAGLTPHDGEERGEVVGLGRNLKVGQRITSGGAVTAPNLSKIDISTLVEPRVIDPAARTKVRVRCLVMLGGKPVTPADLLGEQYARYASDIDLDEISKSDDPVAMADKIKRAIDTRALEREREAERLTGMAMAKRQEAGDIDELQAVVAHEDAVVEHRKALVLRSTTERVRERYAEDKARNESLAALVAAEGDPPDIAASEAERARLVEAASSLEQRLLAMKEAIRQKDVEIRLGKGIVDKINGWKSQIVELNEEDNVSDARLQELLDAENAALRALEMAGQAESRRRALAESLELTNQAADVVEQAKADRMIGSLVQQRVQQSLPEGPIQIQDGQLVVFQGKRKKAVPIDELSTGERWRVALEYGISAVGEGGVLVVPQEAWQACSPELKKQNAEQCRDARVWLITGEVDEGPLRVEDYSAKSPGEMSNLELAS